MKKVKITGLALLTAMIFTISLAPMSASANPVFSGILEASQVTDPHTPGNNAVGYGYYFLDESNPADPKLSYTITFVNLDLDGLQTLGNTDDDVLAVHIHTDLDGQHRLNIFGAPSVDDPQLVVDPVAGTLTGVYDDTDALVPCCPPGGATEPLSGTVLNELKSGMLYVQVHTGLNPSPAGELRGQITSSEAVAGELLSIDSAALLVSGVQSTSWLIPVVLSAAGIGLVFLRRN